MSRFTRALRPVILTTVGVASLGVLAGAGSAQAATAETYATITRQALPRHVGIDAAGYVYADEVSGGTSYFRVPPAGGVVAPTFVTGFNNSNIVQIFGLAADPAGNVFLANNVTTAGYGYPGGVIKVPAGGSKVNWPTTAQSSYTVAVDGSGNVYTSDSSPSDATVTKLDAAGTEIWARSVGASVVAITTDRSGAVFTANRAADTVSRISPAGVVDPVFAHVGDQPEWIGTDLTGNVYTSNAGSGTVSKVTPQGAVTTLMTGSEGSVPRGVGADAAGQVYVVNQYAGFGVGVRNSTLSRIALDGTASVIADVGGFGAEGLAIDGDGDVYVGIVGTGANSLTLDAAGIVRVTVEPNPPPPPVAVLSGTSARITVQPSVTGTPTSVTVTASPGGRTCDIAAPQGACEVAGLAPGTTYTFTATSTGPGGTSAASAPSNAVTTARGPVTPSGGGGGTLAPGLRGAVTRCVGTTCVTVGRMPSGATSVTQRATRVVGAQALSRQKAGRAARGACRVTKSTSATAPARYRCTIRLAPGAWAVTTTASAAGRVVASTTRVVRVRAVRPAPPPVVG